MENQKKTMKYRIDIVIDLDEIQQAIYTEGVWHPAENATAWGVNRNNEPIVDRRVREGLDDLLARMSGYIVSQNINFNLESQNIVLGLAIDKRPLLSLAWDVKKCNGQRSSQLHADVALWRRGQHLRHGMAPAPRPHAATALPPMTLK